MFKAVAFDLEGTVVDVEWAHHESSLIAARELGLELDNDSAIRLIPGWIGGGGEKIARGLIALCAERGLPADFDQIMARKGVLYPELLATMSIQMRPGFLTVFNSLRALGYPIAIGSFTPRERAQILLDKSGLSEVIPPELIVLKEDVTNPKPAPDVYLETARRLRVVPSAQLVFEDSVTGIIAAIAAGSQIVVAVPVYHQKDSIRPLVDAGASRIFWDWREINVRALIQNLEAL